MTENEIMFKHLVDTLKVGKVTLFDVTFDGAHWAKFTYIPTTQDRSLFLSELSKAIEEAVSESAWIYKTIALHGGALIGSFVLDGHAFEIEFKSNGNVVINHRTSRYEFLNQIQIWNYLYEGNTVKLSTLINTTHLYYLRDGNLMQYKDGTWVPDTKTTFSNFQDYVSMGKTNV